jgi:hypothetical protein
MSRTLFRAATALAVACGTAGILNAQTAQPSATQSTSKPMAGSAHAVTYTGCLQPGSALASNRSLTPGASSTNTPPLSGYILTNARPSDASPANQAPPGQSATTTTPPATPPTTPPSQAMGSTASNGGAMYHIVGLQDDELQKLSNQQVEVRGMIETTDATAAKGVTGEQGRPTSSQPATPANPATGTAGTTEAVGTASGSTGTGAAASSTGAQPATMPSAVPSFRASSIRVLSTTCSAGTN